jgi:dienelactone hydrolase
MIHSFGWRRVRFIALAWLMWAGTVAPAAYGQTSAGTTGFSPAGLMRKFSAAPGVYEFVFQARRGDSAFAHAGLHRITSGPVPAAHPAIAMLYLPGTYMNGEIAIDNPRYSLPLYMALHGVDFWAFDYLTHFVPASARPAELAQLQTWTNEMFEADISAAARFVMATTGRDRIFISGFSRGVEFAYLYAAAHPRNVKGLVLFDGSISHGRSGSPPPGEYAEDLAGRHLTWDKRQALLQLVIRDPNAPAPLAKFRTAAENLDHVVYESAGFGGKGGLSNPMDGFADPSVLARVLIRYDRYWPAVQDYEDSFTPLLAKQLASSDIPVLAFSSTNIAADWPEHVEKSAASTGTHNVIVKKLKDWGHLDVICGTHAEPEVFAPTLQWFRHNS